MKYKYNGEWVDINIKALDSLPIGAIIMTVIPGTVDGWVFCDGRTLSRTDYSDLFNVIGTTYGSGDGSTTFNVPDMTGRVPVCLDGTDADFNELGETGGSKELQEHSHNLGGQAVALNGTHQQVQNTGMTGGGMWGPATFGLNTSNTATAGTGNSGNLQPYMVVKFIIKAKNTTPTMASIVDTYSTSTQDGYSCNYINDTNSYLKEETDTGQTYYDGKKIYRKLLTGTSVSGSVVTLQAGLSNINTITKFYGVYGNDYPIPYATSNTGFIIEMYRNGQNINVVFGSSILSNVAFRVIVEYTKN